MPNHQKQVTRKGKQTDLAIYIGAYPIAREVVDGDVVKGDTWLH